MGETGAVRGEPTHKPIYLTKNSGRVELVKPRGGNLNAEVLKTNPHPYLESIKMV